MLTKIITKIRVLGYAIGITMASLILCFMGAAPICDNCNHINDGLSIARAKHITVPFEEVSDEETGPNENYTNNTSST